jgi:hypothetical protein
MSYLDIADAYLRGDFSAAVNAYWSPFYSWLLAATLFIGRPSSYWETTAVHGLHLLLCVLALACFGYFLKELIAYRRASNSRFSQEAVALPEWGLVALGYSVFLWSAVELVTIPFETPDLALLPFVFIACGLLLRIRRSQGGWGSFALLGVVLGFAYLARVAMFPLAFVFLGSAVLFMGNFRKAMPQALIGLVCFFFIAAPYVAAISQSKGRLTIGDAATLNYAWTVGGVSSGWRGDRASRAPDRPARIFDSPAIYAFKTDTQATFTLWHDPSRWHEAVTFHFDWRGHLRAAVRGISHYLRIFFYSHYSQNALAVVFLVLLLMARVKWPLRTLVAPYYIILLPAAAALMMYLVVHVETRYIAPFIAVLWVGLFASIRMPPGELTSTLAKTACGALVAVMIFKLFVPVVDSVDSIIKTATSGTDNRQHRQWLVSYGLSQLGVQPGDKVAIIGDAYRTYWARLAKVQLVAEMSQRESGKFWAADPELKTQIIKAFASTGATAVIASDAPGCASTSGWKDLGDGRYCVFLLNG